jgi:CheY-like chemotaxis protein/HPt (histidine-containing phosphotransfer) domain-containing protein
MGDPLRLTQVLSNLLSNALKFTSRGTVTLRVRVLYQDLQLCRLRFAVADTGIGMNRKQIGQLFQPFTQADVSVTRRYGGTGLGLSICKRLVELMGGSIEVNSTPDSGSEFSFEMDMCLVKPSQLQHRNLRRLPFQRALVVDDQIAAAHVLQAMLRGWNVAVSCCDSGFLALDQLKAASANGAPFDLVLTDWRMPGLDGLGLIDQIGTLHAEGALPKMPAIVLVSSYDMNDVPSQLAERPVAALLAKPVLPSTLHDALAGTVDGATLSVDARATRPTEEVTDYIAAASTLRGQHILLAEDNEVNQQVARSFLESAGLHVTVANNGQEALELAKTGKFSAILMDMHMPEMDGLEASRLIRAMPGGDSVPIIAMTAAVLQDDRQACFEAGMNGFVGKPIDPQELMTMLRKWIQEDALAKVGGPSHSAETAGVLGQLGQVGGLDLAGAMARMGGNQGLFLRLLRGFAERAPAQADQLVGLSTDQLSLWLHTLRGESSNLGATTIETCCKTIEETLASEPDKHPAELIATLGEYLRAFSREIAHSLDEHTGALQNAEIVSEVQNIQPELKALLEQLPDLLTEQRMQAVRHSEKLLALMKDTHWHGLYLPVHTLVEQLQFAAALEALKEFTNQLNG